MDCYAVGLLSPPETSRAKPSVIGKIPQHSAETVVGVGGLVLTTSTLIGLELLFAPIALPVVIGVLVAGSVGAGTGACRGVGKVLDKLD